jgi:hypothetical protein
MSEETYTEIKCPVCSGTHMVALPDVTRWGNVLACSDCGIMKIVTASDIVASRNVSEENR